MINLEAKALDQVQRPLWRVGRIAVGQPARHGDFQVGVRRGPGGKPQPGDDVRRPDTATEVQEIARAACQSGLESPDVQVTRGLGSMGRQAGNWAIEILWESSFKSWKWLQHIRLRWWRRKKKCACCWRARGKVAAPTPVGSSPTRRRPAPMKS